MKVMKAVVVLAVIFSGLARGHAQELQQVTNAPESGTFFLLSGESEGGSPPYPFDPYGGVMAIYQMPGLPNQYLIGDSSEDFQALQSLQMELFTGGGGMTMNSLEFPGEGEEGGEGGTNDYSGWVFGTNDLWIELDAASLTNGTASLIIHVPENITNDVWDVFATTNFNLNFPGLNGTNWTWVARTEAGVTNVTVPLLSDYQCYYRIADLTDTDTDGITDAFEALVSHSSATTNDTDGDGLFDGWSYWNFGSAYGSTANNTGATNDYDGDGVNNLDEQTAESDPNTIEFTLNLGNQHFNTTNAEGSFIVFSGVPSYWTVLVNNTNHDAAVWQPYDGSISFPIGPTNGEYEVELGLKGRATDSEITWNGTVATFDSTSPLLIITYPTNGIVAQPILQLRGYAPEPLATVEYGVTNSGTALLSELGFVTASEFDTNSLEFTTNSFQCYDIELTNGVNYLALRVTDEAGNTTTTNFSVTLDSAIATNVPAGLHLVWPTNGMSLSGSSFTMDGKLDDAGATVFATIISTNGSTNTIEGMVERDGKFWVDGLPLASGTNQLILNVTNSAGLGSVTNLAVIKSAVVLVLSGITGSLWDPYVQVSGTVSDPSQAVWINGVRATVAGDGSWVADKVPTTSGGSAEFEIIAYEPGEPQP